VVRKAIKRNHTNELLAVKIIPYQDEKKRSKIEKEINIIKKLPVNPNLVGVLPYKCYSNHNYYIFMEYCSGGTLEDLRKEKKNCFTESEIFDIFYQIMNGYKVLWDAKILHHDLKLENVLIKDGKYKLSDFGFSIFY
jgi:serine/threonine protein kinase